MALPEAGVPVPPREYSEYPVSTQRAAPLRRCSCVDRRAARCASRCCAVARASARVDAGGTLRCQLRCPALPRCTATDDATLQRKRWPRCASCRASCPCPAAPTGPEALPMVPRGRLHAAAQRHRALHRRIVPLIARLSRSSARTAQLYITLYRDVIHSTRCSRAIYICRCHSLRPLAGTAVRDRSKLAAPRRGPHRRRAADPQNRALRSAVPQQCTPRQLQPSHGPTVPTE